MSPYTEMAIEDATEDGVQAAEDILDSIGENMGWNSAAYRAYEKGVNIVKGGKR